jgi:hypothetical protein
VRGCLVGPDSVSMTSKMWAWAGECHFAVLTLQVIENERLAAYRFAAPRKMAKQHSRTVGLVARIND